MSQLEKDVVAKVKAWCEENKVLFIKFTPFGSKGWPDTVIIFPGGFHTWVELKCKGKKPRKLQDYRMGQLAMQGAMVQWFDDAELCIDYLKDCLDAANDMMKEKEE